MKLWLLPLTYPKFYLRWIIDIHVEEKTNKASEKKILGRGDSGWGTHVNPWLIHVHIWQKPLQYCSD